MVSVKLPQPCRHRSSSAITESVSRGAGSSLCAFRHNIFPTTAPDGTWLATRGDVDYSGGDDDDSAVRIWDPFTGGEPHHLNTAHPRGVDQIVVAPDGTWSVALSDNAVFLGTGMNVEAAGMWLKGAIGAFAGPGLGNLLAIGGPQACMASTRLAKPIDDHGTM